jgi:hypothetical protein
MFRTELNISFSPFKINHSNKLLTIGSCFSQVIGERLYVNKFDVLVNPFGTIFNPVSICRLLESSMTGNFSDIDTSVESRRVWFNHHVHSDFYGTTKEELNSKLKEKFKQVHHYLLQSNTLIITLGTAFVYKLKATNEIVANCHKVPAGNFIKELLTVEEIVNVFTKVIDQFKAQNLKLKIILTVSPVRHIKDTLPLNAISKSILRVACHALSERFPEVFYFPSYEIMMDDLRDYRFYKEDMIHPTEVAEEYIWNKFSDSYFEDETKRIIKEWLSVSKALQHKPFRIDSSEYRNFLVETLRKLELLNGKINVNEEIGNIKNKLPL